MTSIRSVGESLDPRGGLAREMRTPWTTTEDEALRRRAGGGHGVMTDRPSPLEIPERRVVRSRGLALISVLWVVALLAVLAIGILHTGRTDAQLARNLVEAAQAEALADGAIEVALAGLMAPPEAGGWRRDGATYGWRAGGGEVRVRVTEEAGKIDLNAATVDLLAALLQAAGAEVVEAERLAAAIVDYRDEDRLPGPGGAEDPDYLRAGANHGARDAPFFVVDELQQVLGLSTTLYRRIAPALTVHTGRQYPVGASAPRLVRGALMIEDPDADAELLPAEELAPGFDIEVGSTTPALLGGEAAGTNTSSDGEEVPLLIRSEARLDGGARFVREAIAVPVPDTPAAPYLILEWRQGADPEPAP